MNRDLLERRANGTPWNMTFTRSEIKEILAMLDAKDAHIATLERSLGANQSGDLSATYALTQDALNAAALLQARLEALAEYADQT